MPTSTFRSPARPWASTFSQGAMPFDVLGQTGLGDLDPVEAMYPPAAYQAHGEAGKRWVQGPRGQKYQECDNFLSYNNVAPDGTILHGALTAYDPSRNSPEWEAYRRRERTKQMGEEAPSAPTYRLGPLNVAEWCGVVVVVALIVTLLSVSRGGI